MSMSLSTPSIKKLLYFIIYIEKSSVYFAIISAFFCVAFDWLLPILKTQEFPEITWIHCIYYPKNK